MISLLLWLGDDPADAYLRARRRRHDRARRIQPITVPVKHWTITGRSRRPRPRTAPCDRVANCGRSRRRHRVSTAVARGAAKKQSRRRDGGRRVRVVPQLDITPLSCVKAIAGHQPRDFWRYPDMAHRRGRVSRTAFVPSPAARDPDRHRQHPRASRTSGALLEAVRAGGLDPASDVAEIVEAHELTDARARRARPGARQARHRDRRADAARARPYVSATVAGRDDHGRAAALPARGRPAPLLTAAQEVELAKRIERGDEDGEGADDPVEPAARRLDREELPQPGAPVPRPDPGGHARADPRGREVRLAARLQVLDLRDLVDPPGRRARARRQGADDPHAGPHRRATAEDQPRRAARSGRSSGASRPLEEIAEEATLPSSRCARCARPRARRRASTSRSATGGRGRSATSSPATSPCPRRLSSSVCAARRCGRRSRRSRSASARWS